MLDPNGESGICPRIIGVRRMSITCHRIRPGFILLLLFLTFISAPCLAASVPATGEKAITVVMDNNYPPFSFRDSNGELVGISVDMWHLWEKQTGRKVEITG
ncbi:MAG: transporter substrate-binding domain-containing protein, partial [Methanoregula sp.]|nr:transporter substrate-binding domain-containing protein [Methanoregula sp.]